MDEIELRATQASRLATLLREAIGTRTITTEIAMLAKDLNAGVNELWLKSRGG